MIFVEYSIYSLKTLSVAAKINKEFDNTTEFIKWYEINKKDTLGMINVMKYNPKENEDLTVSRYKELIDCSIGKQNEN